MSHVPVLLMACSMSALRIDLLCGPFWLKGPNGKFFFPTQPAASSGLVPGRYRCPRTSGVAEALAHNVALVSFFGFITYSPFPEYAP